MSTISVLAFPSEDTTPPPTTDNFDIEAIFNSHEWAFQIESPKPRFLNIRKPYNIVYTRNNTTDPVPFISLPRQPTLKIHVAIAKHPNLLKDVSRALSDVPASTPSNNWLDAALTSLQSKFIVQRFSIPKFHQFILDSLSKMPSATFRRMSSGTTELDYLSLLSNSAEVKKMLAPIHADGDASGASTTSPPATAGAPTAGPPIASY